MVKYSSITRFLIYMISLATLIVLGACGQINERIITTDVNPGNDVFNMSIEDFDVTENTTTSAAKEGVYSSVTVLSDEDRILLRENLFIGQGDMALTGGDGMMWYYMVFDLDYHFVSIHIINAVSHDEFTGWTAQFEMGQRDWRDFSLRTFVEDFGISMQDLIVLEEELLGLPMSEIDYLVTWARGVEMPPPIWNEEAAKAFRWSARTSLSDIQAIFSNDVNEIWAAFPGYGILHNNRAYSPEWLFQNIERAIYGELIPLQSLEGVIDIALNHFGLGGELIDIATATIQSAKTALSAPTPQQLTFNLNTHSNTVPFSAAPATPTIAPITVNSWDVIMDSMVIGGRPQGRPGTPVSNPTKAGYTFMGWYLDEDFTVAITETFRMPARNATLYARWEVSNEPITPPHPRYFTLTFDVDGVGGWGNVHPNHLNPILIPEGAVIIDFLHDAGAWEIRRDGHDLVGWSRADGLFVLHQPHVLDSRDVMPPNNLTIRALWEPRFEIWEPFGMQLDPLEIYPEPLEVDLEPVNE